MLSCDRDKVYSPLIYKLPAVKKCLYHPQIPTFRRMDMDTAAHKLPHEHCRTTSKCSTGNFKAATVTLYQAPEKPININPKHLKQNDHYPSVKEKESMTSYKAKHDQLPFSGYSMRYLSPAVTGSWKYLLRQRSDDRRSIPATI